MSAVPRLTAAEKPLLKKCRVCDHAPDCRPTRKVPKVDTIMRWDWDKGGCKTPSGSWVEPDGHDKWGCPSWMRVLHLI